MIFVEIFHMEIFPTKFYCREDANEFSSHISHHKKYGTKRYKKGAARLSDKDVPRPFFG